MKARPNRSEAAEYYFTYIDRVGDGDICQILEVQSRDTLALLQRISDTQSLYRYDADKWTIRQVVCHINDTERVFTFRAFWFARGFDTPLPSFDRSLAVSTGMADRRSWASHVDEFRAVRTATLAFFQNLSQEAWLRSGIASDHSFSVRALAYIVAGHVAHHAAILKERYLPTMVI